MRNALIFMGFAVVLMGVSRCPHGQLGQPTNEDEGGAGSGTAPEACGDTVCEGGQVCCNESCGICTEPGGVCTQQFCGDEDDVDQGEPGDSDEGGEASLPPNSRFCGGIAALPCPGAGTCVDDPADDCDPARGGADCGGICDCSGVLLLCAPGTRFDDDPNVCSCEPFEDEGEPGDGDTEPDEGVLCGPTVCGVGEVCCNESCGICTEPGGFCTEQFCGAEPDPKPDVPTCGGFAGLACPGEGECVDDPSDDCDPQAGGADCIGVCECTIGPLIDCVPDRRFDDAPSVCACVPIDDGASGEACGNTTCGAGQVCCNASCGICTPPDGACIQIACD